MRALAYVRLSRQDQRKGDTIDNHIGIVRHLAEQHHLDLPSDCIISEIEQSDRIDTREGLLHILQELRAGRASHLVVFDVARMTRGLEDNWAEIKRALFRHQATLVTPRGLHRFDNALDTTILDIEAVLARRYRWDYSVRRHQHNLERTRRGRRSCGVAPYGYAWIPATYEGATLVKPGRVEVIPEEYAILEEILRRARTEGTVAIAADLNARGVQTSGARRRTSPACTTWSAKVIRDIIGNPWYAGYVAHRCEIARERGQVALPRERWTLSEEPGDWLTPIDMAEWTELQEIVAARARAPRVRKGLLTGILHCHRDAPMALAATDYRCPCAGRHRGQRPPEPHAGSSVNVRIIDAYAMRIVELALSSLDDGALPVMPAPRRSRREMYLELAAMQRDLDGRQRAMDDLMRRAEFYLSLPDFGRDRYEANLRTLAAEGDAVKTAIAELRAELAKPDQSQTKAILEAVAAHRDSLWDELPGWTRANHIALVRCVIASIRLGPPRRPHATLSHVDVEMQPAFAHITPPPICPPGKTVRSLIWPKR